MGKLNANLFSLKNVSIQFSNVVFALLVTLTMCHSYSSLSRSHCMWRNTKRFSSQRNKSHQDATTCDYCISCFTNPKKRYGLISRHFYRAGHHFLLGFRWVLEMIQCVLETCHFITILCIFQSSEAHTKKSSTTEIFYSNYKAPKYCHLANKKLATKFKNITSNCIEYLSKINVHFSEINCA